MEQPSFSTARLDHLGIIAGTCRKFRIAERIDALLPATDRLVSHGESAVAMVINAMGFVSRPLYLTPEFFQNKPIDLLIRPGLTAEQLNDDALGRSLDAFYEYGITELFAGIAQGVLQDLDLPVSTAHLDTSSFSFHGHYSDNGPQPDPDDRHPITITFGYSKDKRSDLRQAVLSLITEHRAGLPIWLEALDGNSSDSKSFPATLDAFTEQLKGDTPLFVMDAAFYSEENVASHKHIRWVSRVPETLAAVQALYETDFEEEDWKELDENHSYREVEQEYGGVLQRWVLVYSLQRAHRQQAAFKAKLEKARLEANRALKSLQRRSFDCEADARKAAEAMAGGWKFHQLSFQVASRNHYKTRGKPAKGAVPDSVSWQIREGQVQPDAEAIAAARKGHGFYVIASNELDKDRVPASELLVLYKSQTTTVERGFRFLKDPLFFASAMYLKKPSRIMALLMIMTLSLLLYAATEYLLRETLKAQEQTVPDQKGKPTARPTLRRVFQMFDGIDLLEIRTGETVRRQTLNLTELQRKILDLLSPEVRNLYTDPGGCGR